MWVEIKATWGPLILVQFFTYQTRVPFCVPICDPQPFQGTHNSGQAGLLAIFVAGFNLASPANSRRGLVRRRS